MRTESSGFLYSDETTDVDLQFVHHELSHSYWAGGIPFEVVAKSVQHSMCFSVFSNGQQVAFARVITDQATFAYLCDVIVNEHFRGKGIGKQLMKFIMEHPELQQLRRFMLATRDAHTLYEKFGFRLLSAPEKMMEITRPDIYKAGQSGSTDSPSNS
ncbi:MAG: GNAT family N-acetyltransferase [Bacteroidia bacterium]